MTEKNRTIFFAVFLFGFVFDQFLKHLIRLGGGFYVCNFGIAWSLKVPSWVMFPLWFLVAGALVYVFLKKNQKNELGRADFLAYSLIFSGALSNFFDRIYFGCVVDYVDLGFFPVFNLADALISIGVFLLGLKIIKNS